MKRSLIKAESRKWRYLPVVLTLGAGIIASTISSILVSKWERATFQAKYERQADNVVSAIQNNFEQYSFASSYIEELFAASHFVEREEFGVLARNTISHQDLGISEIGWARRVPDRRKKEYEQNLKSQGIPDFRIWEYSKDKQIITNKRSEYFPTVYVEPQEKRDLIGYDVAAETGHQNAIDKARDTKQASIARYVLPDDNEFIIYRSVYDNDLPDSSLVNLRDYFKGLVYIAFQPEKVVKRVVEKIQPDRVNFYLYEITTEDLHSSFQSKSKENLILAYDYDSKEVKKLSEIENIPGLADCPADPSGVSCTRRLEIADREWSILILPTAGLGGNRWDSVLVLTIGLLTSTSLAIYLWVSIASAVTTEKLVTTLRQVVQNQDIE